MHSVPLNIIKRFIFCNVQTPYSNVPAVNIHIFSLVHQLRLLLALTFVALQYPFGWCLDMYFQWARVYLRDV